MNTTLIKPALTTLSALVLAACGGGGGTTATGPTISGGVVKGPVLGASVCVYALTNGAKGVQIPLVGGPCATTGPSGSYNLALPAGTSGELLVESSGGSYCSDESAVSASGACTAPATKISLAGSTMSSVVSTSATSAAATVYVTPLTTAAISAAGSVLSIASFNAQFNRLAGLIVGAGTTLTAATQPNATNQPFLAQLATYMQGGGTLQAAVASLAQGTVPGAAPVVLPAGVPNGDTTAATINPALVATYNLHFFKGSGSGCGTLCSFTEGQAVTAVVSANGSLTVAGKVLGSPFFRKFGGVPNSAEVIWLDSSANIEYALTNNTTGVVNEINVGNAAIAPPPSGVPGFIGQIR
jgi:hypothetical protein